MIIPPSAARAVQGSILFVLGLLAAVCPGHPVISEFLALNDSGRTDADGEFSDWIELHNPAEETVNLDGYFLTDSIGNLTKWRFPAVGIDPGGYLVVFASGKDRTGPELHTSFRLDGGGEYLALVAPDGITVLSEFAPEYPRQFTDISYGTALNIEAFTTETPIALEHAARYYVPIAGEPPGGDWRTPDFDDFSWALGENPFGFGYPDQPINDPGGDLGSVMHNAEESIYHGGVYLRFPFQVGDPTEVVGMTLQMKYDDGFVAYLNGQRLVSANAPTPAVFGSTAIGDRQVGEEDALDSFGLDFGGHLRAGTNILAIHGLNRAHDDPDFLLVTQLEVRLRDPSRPGVGYFDTPTPGAPNGTAFPGFIEDTKFSVDRGFFDAAFDLEVTTATPGVEIRYTTDGSEPTASHGSVYTGPITISRTTTLQAAAFAPGFRPTNVDTQTYLFIRDVERQRNTGGLYWDTEMDPNVVTDPGEFTVADGLAAIPTLSIVMDPDDLFGSQGIYSNATQRASDNPFWERKCSAEYFYHPAYDGPYRIGNGFQIDCGIQINGNFSRLSHNPKHSFRLKFKDQYGPAKLDFPLFPDSPVDEFDTVVIRTGHNQGWATGHASTQMLRNQYARDIQGYDPAQVVADGNHIHLYLNGQYWGLYNFHERPDDSFAAEHWGGPKEDYDGFKGLRAGGSNQARIFAGDRRSWSRMFARADRDMRSIDSYYAVLDLLDVDQLIDYMIGILYTGDRDGPTGIYPPAEQPKNFYAVRRRHADGKFRFFRWDSEFIFESTGTDMSERGGPENPAGLHKRLRGNPEYRLRFGDRVHKHFLNGGGFAPRSQQRDYLARAGQIEVAMVAESARWGDSKREPPFTRDENWVPERDRIVRSWMPGRHDVIIDQFKADGLYPDVEAPSFRINDSSKHGGQVPAGAVLTMSAPQGTIYYTVDGSDPRLAASPVESVDHVLVGEFANKRAIMPTEPIDELVWFDPGFDDGAWPTGTKGAGYEQDAGFSDLLDPNLDFGAQADSTKNETIYLRVEFQVADPSIYDTLTLLLRYDDGFVAYLNGAEIARDLTPGPANTPVAYDASASGEHNDTQAVNFQTIHVDQHVNQLRAGRNVLALHALNNGSADNDFLIWPRLEAKEITGGATGDLPSAAAVAYDGAITLQGTGPVKARALHDGEWSALSDAAYLVDAERATSDNLIISELHYHPAAPTEAEDGEDYDKRKDFEWVELLNVGTRTVDLSEVTFTEGIRFDFGRRSSLGHLEPGGRLLVVKNREAFLFRHPNFDVSLIAGEYGLRLSDDGEELVLAGGGGEIARFTYNDRGGWPESADGDGPSLVLRKPESRPDLNDPANWRPSSGRGGSPGGDDRTTLAGWLAQRGFADPHGDPDGNGLTHFMNYAYGGEFAPVIEVRALEVDGLVEEYLTITYHLNATADDIEIMAESSGDLANWSPVEVVEVSRTWEEDGTAVILVRDLLPLPLHQARFVRLNLTSAP